MSLGPRYLSTSSKNATSKKESAFADDQAVNPSESGRSVNGAGCSEGVAGGGN